MTISSLEDSRHPYKKKKEGEKPLTSTRLHCNPAYLCPAAFCHGALNFACLDLSVGFSPGFYKLPALLASLRMEHSPRHYLQRSWYSKTSPQTSSTLQGKAWSKHRLHFEKVHSDLQNHLEDRHTKARDAAQWASPVRHIESPGFSSQ